jgi:hypothetical protein
MIDVVYIMISTLFFGLYLLYTKGCERLQI